MPYATTNVKGVNFTVPDYYKISKMLGQGAYGIVVEATDSRNGSHVAIKKLEKVFGHLVDAKRILREIALLRFLSHENVASMLDFIAPEDTKNLDELYVVFGFMQTDMYKIISSRQSLSDEHMQFFMYQLLRGLAYIHSAGVVHRDLKPSNLLLNSDCALQICDFGLARLTSEMSQTDTKMTEYVSTRWYRAPEVILGDPKYGQAIDIFSCGCIFAELILRTPLFPGRDYINQLHLVMDVLGTPSAEFLSRIDNMSAKQYVEQQPKQAPIDLKTKIPNASPEAIELINQMLKMDASQRPSAADCMKHKYFEGIWDEADLLLYKDKQIKLFFEEHELTRDLLELGFLNEARKFHPELGKEVERRAVKLGIVAQELVE
ncbi:Mitogen-activated_protein kinase [Hexamita inflata]|uniref:Mitogen-activated protein kinase n=1 Tax=Hexamita inflata TaxID=28002 RepID=A0AA86UUV3_9EUKA|nr:Mitogen-activated protein kinase [Hexamita inflata]CAI9943544.1 Mitogen-activated protein kinase [Hexamita inflata]CAI9968591.1 Mitogen-activated protein kinase [Hexamita inflata]CAI9972670.1 Mitogen-activated protein kinase [Hexamita inflata]